MIAARVLTSVSDTDTVLKFCHELPWYSGKGSEQAYYPVWWGRVRVSKLLRALTLLPCKCKYKNIPDNPLEP